MTLTCKTRRQRVIFDGETRLDFTCSIADCVREDKLLWVECITMSAPHSNAESGKQL